jgi:cytochrome c oxidase assembly protein subunit 15
VEAGAHRLRAVRRLELSPTGFQKLAIASAASLYLIVVTGALVRLTASGLGCNSWPGCEQGSFFPEQGYHGVVEFSNRAVAILPIGLSLATAVAAWRRSDIPRWAAWLAVAVLSGTLAQAPLGLITIKTGLHPLMVMTHFLLALVVLAGAVVVALTPWRGTHDAALPVWVRWLGLGLAAAALALVTSGAVATAAGPHPGDSAEVHRLWSLHSAVYVHVRATAIFGTMFLILLAYLFSRREEQPLLVRAAAGLLGVLLVQMVVGELQYRTHLPWGLVLVHVGLAGAVFAGSVAFVTLLWRPRAGAAREWT